MMKNNIARSSPPMTYCINPKCPKPSDPLNANNRICRQCGSQLLIAGRYQVTKLLGEGGFAKTFEVDDRGFTKVLKVLHLTQPKAIALFQQEARILQKLKHPGIPRVEPQGYFTIQVRDDLNPLHCLVMQKIYGQNLEDWFSDRNHYPISQTQAIEWLKQLTDILQEVHRLQFFHRDIKPSNIMLQPSGQLALIDFGSVRQVTGTYLAKMGVGHRGTVISSKGYAPPEQENGHTVPQSDFFAVGRTFVHLIAGKHPLDFYDPATDTLQWRHAAPKIDPTLADFIDYLIERLPGNRPQSTQVILQRLNDLETSLQKTSRLTLSLSPRWATFDRFKKGGLAVGAMVFIGIVGYLEIRGYHYVSANFAQNSQTESELSRSPAPVQDERLPSNSTTIADGTSSENVQLTTVRSTSFASAIFDRSSETSEPDSEKSSTVRNAIGKPIKKNNRTNPETLAQQTISLYKTLLGHEQDVKSVAIAPNGTEIASGSFDGKIKIWNLKTGQLIQTLTGHSEAVEVISSIAISPDGQMLVSSSNSYGGTIKIWDLSTGFLISTLKTQDAGVSVVAISPDSKLIASGGDDGSITLWDLELGQEIGTFYGHFGRVFSVSFSHNGELLASGGEDGSIYLWNSKNLQETYDFNVEPERRLIGHRDTVHSVTFSPDSQQLASGSADKTIKLWNVKTENAIATFTGNSGTMLSVAISPNGNILAGGSLLGRIKLWNLNTGELIDTLSAHNRWVESVVFSPDGHILASGSSDRSVKLWELQ